jgi:Na+-translocating ferredoxin:NAD+ oxidoreductase RnfC subunit
LKQLMKKLGVLSFDHPSEYSERLLTPRTVSIPLTQHIGAPAVAVVAAGQRVERGACIADIPEGKLGARVHASITGIVRSIDTTIVIEQG